MTLFRSAAGSRELRGPARRATARAPSRRHRAERLRSSRRPVGRGAGGAGRRGGWASSPCSRCATSCSSSSACATSSGARARSSLIVVGLMLGTTIIASVAAHRRHDGPHGPRRGRRVAGSDRRVRHRSRHVLDDRRVVGPVSAAQAYFPADDAVTVVDARGRARRRSGGRHRPAIIEQVAAQNPTSRRTEPRLTLFASDAGSSSAPFGLTVDRRPSARVRCSSTRTPPTSSARRAGDTIVVFAGCAARPSCASPAIGTYHGSRIRRGRPRSCRSRCAGAARAPGEINHVLVSNTGGETSGAGRSDEVVALPRRRGAPARPRASSPSSRTGWRSPTSRATPS